MQMYETPKPRCRVKADALRFLGFRHIAIGCADSFIYLEIQ